jgi:hypothetical protein
MTKLKWVEEEEGKELWCGWGCPTSYEVKIASAIHIKIILQKSRKTQEEETKRGKFLGKNI